MQNKVNRQWLPINVVCCQATSSFEKEIVYVKVERWLCQWSLVEIDETLDFHPFDAMYVSPYLNMGIQLSNTPLHYY